jgi:hypothetical protein
LKQQGSGGTLNNILVDWMIVFCTSQIGQKSKGLKNPGSEFDLYSSMGENSPGKGGKNG